MKKTYIQPRTTCMTIVFQQAFLTSSTTIEVKNADYNENMTDLSRDGGFWDDEE